MMTAAPLITSQAIAELSPALFNFALRAVGRPEDAEDLVQETWFSALRTAQSFEGRSSLRTWLTSIMRRRMADRFRRERATEEFLEEEHAAERVGVEQLEYRALASLSSRALAKLGPLERAAVVLCDVEDVDRDEVCERLQVTRGHLRVLLHRARNKLEQSLRASGVSRV